MKKLFYLTTISLAILTLNSCQKEEADKSEITPEILLSQTPEFDELQAKCSSMSKTDIIAILEKNGEIVAYNYVPVGDQEIDVKSTNEPDPGSITLEAEAKYSIVFNSGYPFLVSLMKWHWNTGGSVGICAADYAGPDWIYHIAYYWMDVATEEIHGIRTRGHSCIYNGTGSQDHCWRSQNMKVVAILGKWYIYNTVTGEKIATSGYIPSDPIVAFTTNKLMCE